VRALLTVAGVLAGVWVALVLLAWGFQRQLIYLPDRSPATPPDDVEEVFLVTEDGLELVAWQLRARRQAVSRIVVTPGNAGNRVLRLPLARGLAARGHDVLLVEYRGYGGNPGRPSEGGLVRDARAAVDHLVGSVPATDAAELPLVLLGESIGSGVAAALAAQHPPDGLVLRSPFPSLADVAARHHRFLPVRTLLRERFPVEEQLAGMDVPLLVVAGGADTIVPTDLSRRVASATDARYLELPGVDHNDRALLDGDDYLDAVDAFVRDDLRAPGPG
jgi:uncharacterized protein